MHSMGHQYSLGNNCMTAHDLELYTRHLDRMFRDMDLCICYWHMLLYDHSQHLSRILVYIPCMGHQSIPEDKHKNQRHSFLGKLHWLHMGMDYTDLLVLQWEQLKKKKQ